MFLAEGSSRLEITAVPTAGFTAGMVLKGTYRIVEPLAEGGCGEVYLAAHTRLPGNFAVKVLHNSLVRDAEALARFRQEAEITSTLRHPHIVQVFDFNVTDAGVPYLVMELLEGTLLADLVRTGAPFDASRAANIVDQIAQALHAAHARGVVHRDLKPENVMLLEMNGAEDFVKVLDFGISQASWRPRLTKDDRVSGTPQYMAPEQACGLRECIDHRSDQFSLAAIAYALLTGREPFRGDDPIAVLYQVVHREPPAPSEVNRALEDAVSDVIVRGLSKKPEDRYGDVLEFAEALRNAVATAAADAPIGAQRAPWSGPRVGGEAARCRRADRVRGDAGGRHVRRPCAGAGDEAAHSADAVAEPGAPTDRHAGAGRGVRGARLVASIDPRSDAERLVAGRARGARADRRRTGAPPGRPRTFAQVIRFSRLNAAIEELENAAVAFNGRACTAGGEACSGPLPFYCSCFGDWVWLRRTRSEGSSTS